MAELKGFLLVPPLSVATSPTARSAVRNRRQCLLHLGRVFVTVKVAPEILVKSCDVEINTSATFDSLLTEVIEIENVEIEC